MIVGLDSGVHNMNLENSGKRIIEGGTWKPQRVITIIPAGKMIPVQTYLSHCALMFPPNNANYRISAVGLEVGEAYSRAIEDILNHPELSQWEYILTIEHDNLPKSDGILRLIRRMEERPDLSCIGGLYWTKGEEGVPQIWGDIKNPTVNYLPQPPDKNGGVIECYGTGMGFNLWRLSMFKDTKLRRPWFKTLTGLEGQGLATQDLYFWNDANKQGYKCGVDCSVPVGHLDINTGIVW